jgi:hypothetical protein
MSTQWTQEAIQENVKKIIDRATTDKEFRALALSNPAQAVEQTAGMPIPPGVKLQFVDNARANFTVVLPDMQEADSSELSDVELEQVAGGRGGGSSCPGNLCNPMALSITS